MPQPTRERLLLKDGHVGFAETQLQIVIKAAALVEPGRVAAYLRLREMAATGRPEEHSLLEARFGEFYGMDGHSPPPGAVLALLQTITRPVTPATYVSLLTALAGLDDTQSRTALHRRSSSSGRCDEAMIYPVRYPVLWDHCRDGVENIIALYGSVGGD